VNEIPGMGLESGEWKLGRARWAGGAVGTIFSCHDQPIAAFFFEEQIRPAAKSQILSLGKSGYDVFLLSGDQSARVTAMAGALGLPATHAFGDLLPEDKARLVRERWNGNSLMIGDGANDSHAFDASLCRGTPSVDSGLLEHKADFYILGASLAGLATLFAASLRHLMTTRAVFAFAMTYNATAITASLAGHMSPLVAAVIMPLSSLASIAIVLTGFRIPKNHQTDTQP
jgi:Cu2+-exporting ATPase